MSRKAEESEAGKLLMWLLLYSWFCGSGLFPLESCGRDDVGGVCGTIGESPLLFLLCVYSPAKKGINEACFSFSDLYKISATTTLILLRATITTLWLLAPMTMT